MHPLFGLSSSVAALLIGASSAIAEVLGPRSEPNYRQPFQAKRRDSVHRGTGMGAQRARERMARERAEREMFGAPALGIVNNKAIRHQRTHYADRPRA